MACQPLHLDSSLIKDRHARHIRGCGGDVPDHVNVTWMLGTHDDMLGPPSCSCRVSGMHGDEIGLLVSELLVSTELIDRAKVY